MPRDFGLAVSPHFRDSPLWVLPDRALRVWLVLSAYAAHGHHVVDVDGCRVPLEAGEVAMSYRTLRAKVGGGMSQISRAVRALVEAGAIEASPVARSTVRAFPVRERSRSQNGNAASAGVRSRSENAARSVLTRFKVNGLRTLARNPSVPGAVTRSKNTLSRYSRGEREEIARVERLLEMEGR